MRGQRARVGRAGFRRCQYESPVARCYAAGVKRVLLTGMSGTGKSTVVAALAARGYKAVDLDTDEWSHWVPVSGNAGQDDVPPTWTAATQDPGSIWQNWDWVWREDRIQHLLSTEDAELLFVSGCASNQGKFRRQFDHVVL